MSRILYPSDGFIRNGKKLAKSGEGFSVEVRSAKRLSYIEDLGIFLFGEGRDVGSLRFIFAFYNMIPFLVVHFFSLGLGARASYAAGVITYKF